MNYKEIKEKTKKMIGKQDTVTDEELENIEDELIDLIYEAEEYNSGELVQYVSDIQIYDKVKRGISRHTEPRKLRKIITDMRYELGRPAKIREKVEYTL